MTDIDAQFFADHPDRQARIRKPQRTIEVDKRTRQSRVVDECEDEFLTLGDHRKDRRRILLYRVPRDNVHFDPERPQIIKIPFLLFASESVEDTDAILLPIIHEIMENELRKNWRA